MHCELTHEDLSLHLGRELEAGAAATLEAHLAGCERCRGHLQVLRRLEQDLARLPRAQPSDDALMRTRQALWRDAYQPPEPEVMTLQEVARYLRLTPEELEGLVLELPVFELAWQLRLRRQKLLEWIESRERVATHRRAKGLMTEGLTEIA